MTTIKLYDYDITCLAESWLISNMASHWGQVMIVDSNQDETIEYIFTNRAVAVEFVLRFGHGI